MNDRLNNFTFIFCLIFILYLQNFKNKSWNDEDLEIKDHTKLKSISFIILWLVWLIVWWKLIVDSAVEIATSFGLSPAFIWVTIVAIWTSLPELASSVAAALKKYRYGYMSYNMK